MLLSGMVERYHVVPTISRDTVGEHSFGVAWLCGALAGGKPRAELLMAAILHDVTELTTGDTPSNIKRQLGVSAKFAEIDKAMLERLSIQIPELTEEEQNILSIADGMDGLLHCCYERALGNRVIETVYERYVNYVKGYKLDNRAQDLLFAIAQIWSIYNHG